MPVRFACPVCASAFTVGDASMGTKADCRTCGQLLIVPFPTQSGAMLGVYLADDVTTDPREVSFNDLSLRHADEAKKAIEAVYREWMAPGETLIPRLKAEIDRRRAELGLRTPDRPFVWGPRLRRNPAIEAEFPELRQLPDGSPEWFRRWRKLHLQRYPNCDQETRDNLDLMVQQAENEAAGGLFD